MIEIKLSLTEVENLIDFFEMNLIENIREDTDIDNIEWLCDMCAVYKKLKYALGNNSCEEKKDR